MEDLDLEQVRRHYSTLVTEELIRLRDNYEVSDQALPIPLEELGRRGVDVSDLANKNLDEIDRQRDEIERQIGEKSKKRALAGLVVGALFLSYLFVGGAVFGWQHGGGFIPLIVVVAALVALWRRMTR